MFRIILRRGVADGVHNALVAGLNIPLRHYLPCLCRYGAVSAHRGEEDHGFVASRISTLSIHLSDSTLTPIQMFGVHSSLEFSCLTPLGRFVSD